MLSMVEGAFPLHHAEWTTTPPSTVLRTVPLPA